MNICGLLRTPTWNMAPNPDKQYLLKVTGKMEPIEQKFTDILQQKRLQTLQSVDDLVEKVRNLRVSSMEKWSVSNE